ncbi:MAG TPA: type II toxin-antitoxin system HicB family antitoxin [Candidatus Brocadiia bacterium]|nr:type II toxin-antitoxin system HicB family antitoxin [Candidatus Brocadiales bacterium]
MKYRIVVHKSKYGFNVYCPILPGCNSQGNTLEEALKNIKDAIITYLDMVKKEILSP